MQISKLLISLAGITIATYSLAPARALSLEPIDAQSKANAAATISNVNGHVNGNPKSSAKRIPGQVTFAPRPGKDKPVITSGAGTRGACLAEQAALNEHSLTLIVPAITPVLTAEAKPTFLFYVPKSKAQQVEFRLFANIENELGEPQTGIYRQTINLSDQLNGEAGIVRYTLPEMAPELALEQSYEWSVALVCNQNMRSRDIVVKGAIERVELSANLAADLAQASPAEQATLYANDGIWYEAAAILAELNQAQNGSNSNAAQLWQSLLGTEQVNLTAIASDPIVISN